MRVKEDCLWHIEMDAGECVKDIIMQISGQSKQYRRF